MLATAASVGIVSSTGDFRVDGSAIRGNSTVFEGSIVETAGARSNVQLGDFQITLLPDSRLKAQKDYAVLEKGWGIVRQGAVEAASYRITPNKGSSVIVQLTTPRNVNVVVQSGDAQVRTARGVMVASLRSGMGMAFTAQVQGAPSGDRVTLSGKVTFENNKCTLTQSSQPPATYELRGWDQCSVAAGWFIKIQGTTAGPGVVTADPDTAMKIKESDAIAIAAAGTGAAAATVAAGVTGTAVVAAGAAAATGISLGAGTIAAIAAGATATGLGVAGAEGAFAASPK